MLFSGLSRTRLGRVPSRISISTPTLRARAATRPYSTRSASSRNSVKYIAATGIASSSGLVWLITSSARDDVPSLEKRPPAKHSSANRGPSKDEVTSIISREAYSYLVRNISGVDRYDGAQVGSNSPCEDQFVHGRLPSPWSDGDQWMAWGVFDGHVGRQTAEVLQEELVPYVRSRLEQAELSSHLQNAPDEAVQRAIARGFLDLDEAIFNTALDAARSNEPLQDKVDNLLPAFSGSCALLSLYDPVTSTLHVACTGDSRAVLGQQRPDGTWDAIPLSVDQTGRNEEEIARLYKEHPGEENIVKDGRVLGIMVSRAFGDARWKWPLELQQELHRRFSGPAPLTPRYDVRTPPYLTAEPVVTTTKIDPTRASFLIMATDGMWDMMSSHQAVNLVGDWLHEQQAAEKKKQSPPEFADGPVDFERVNERFEDTRKTVQDDNAAVHLVRNSLGGNHHELVAGRLAYDPPHSRYLRDDTTVQVVFFNTQHLRRQ
ncbi:hypothetical protein PVAR5_7128 [Paecilomyces variotii No. 5]|uniref:PPM-type phosphatase domain-containing protein n=1 Tax=Byssochlamys spectabilis (strain No. 5 / NBRC 109023) TaxID=1356009 RepID=V5FKK9_BYSSN|nr:hypothetical protein PVAR5_7128 [Paecilomyces variotii No. 5]